MHNSHFMDSSDGWTRLTSKHQSKWELGCNKSFRLAKVQQTGSTGHPLMNAWCNSSSCIGVYPHSYLLYSSICELLNLASRASKDELPLNVCLSASDIISKKNLTNPLIFRQQLSPSLLFLILLFTFHTTLLQILPIVQFFDALFHPVLPAPQSGNNITP